MPQSKPIDEVQRDCIADGIPDVFYRAMLYAYQGKSPLDPCRRVSPTTATVEWTDNEVTIFVYDEDGKVLSSWSKFYKPILLWSGSA